MEVFGKCGAAAVEGATSRPPRHRLPEDTQKIASLLTSRGGFFAGFGQDVLEEACQQVELRLVRRGATLFKEGSAPLEVFVVAAGRLKVSRHGVSRRNAQQANQASAESTQEQDDRLEVEPSAPALSRSRLSSSFQSGKTPALMRLLPSVAPAEEPKAGKAESTKRKAGASIFTAAMILQKVPTEVPQEEEHMSHWARLRGDAAPLRAKFISAPPTSTDSGAFAGLVMALRPKPRDVQDELRSPGRLDTSLVSVIRALAEAGLAKKGKDGQPRVKKLPYSIAGQKEVVPAAPFGQQFESFHDRVQEVLVSAGGGQPGSPACGASKDPARGSRRPGGASQASSPAPSQAGGSGKANAGSPTAAPSSPSGNSLRKALLDALRARASTLSLGEPPGEAAPVGEVPLPDTDVRVSVAASMGKTARSIRQSMGGMELKHVAEATSDAFTGVSEATVGQVVGLKACLSERPHEWSAAALEDCHLLSLRGRALKSLVEMERRRRRGVREEALLNAVHSLRSADKEKVERLADCFRSSTHRRGAVLCWEGEIRPAQPERDRLLILIDGNCRAVKAWTGSDAQRLTGDTTPASPGPGASRARGGAGGAAATKDVGTLLPGHVVNGASQLLGTAEPFTVVVDSAEAVVISAARTELARLAGSGLLENLRSAAEEFASWHQQRLQVLAGQAEGAASPRHRGRRDGAVHGGATIPPEYLHTYPILGDEGTKEWSIPVPPAMPPPAAETLRPLPLAAAAGGSHGGSLIGTGAPHHSPSSTRRGGSKGRRGVPVHAAAQASRPTTASAMQRSAASAEDDEEAEDEPLDSSGEAERSVGADSWGGHRRPKRRPTIADAILQSLETPRQSALGSTGNFLVDATMGPEDLAALAATHQGTARDLPEGLWPVVPQAIAAATAQLRERDEFHRALGPYQLERLELRGEKALLVPISPIDPPFISALSPRAPHIGRHLVVASPLDPSDAGESHAEASVMESWEAAAADGRSSEVSEQPCEATLRPKRGAERSGCRGLSELVAAPVPPLLVCGASPRRRILTEESQDSEGLYFDSTPLLQAQLDELSEALAMMEVWRLGVQGQETGNAYEGAAIAGELLPVELSQMSTEMGHPSTFLEESTVWDQMFSVMSSMAGESPHSSKVLRHTPRQPSRSGAQQQRPRTQGSGGMAAAILPPSGLIPRPKSRPQGTTLKPLVPVAGKSGRKPLFDAGPLHVHSIEHFLDTSWRDGLG